MTNKDTAYTLGGSRLRQVAILVLAMSIGVVLGGWLFGGTSPDAGSEVQNAQISETSTQTWTCSMHPQVQQPEFGQCPLCGMDLSPLVQDAGSNGAISFTLSERAVQLANIQTTPVTRDVPTRAIQLNGTVAVSETTEFAQTSHIAGRIEKLMVTYKGQMVQKGDVVAMIYSPELITAQEELLEAVKLAESHPNLLRAARAKLRNWKLKDQHIDEIVRKGRVQEELPIVADISGTVLRLNVALGDHLQMGETLYQLADLSSAWVLFDVYEADLSWIKVGDSVQFASRSRPDQTFTGNIQFIDPVVDTRSRTSKARVILDNSEGLLRTGQWVVGTVESTLELDGLPIVIPMSSVMWTGERSLVYVATPAQSGMTFEAREVLLGAQLGEMIIVREGLEDVALSGGRVVREGAFVLDSAAQLQGRKSMMNRMQNSETGVQTLVTTAREIAEPIAVNEAEARLFSRLLQGYLTLSENLAQDDLQKAERDVQILRGRLNKITKDSVSETVYLAWNGLLSTMELGLQTMEQASDIQGFRRGFAVWSKAWVAWMQQIQSSTSLLDAPIYIEYCPMAEDNQGAYWLSESKEIRNPYFGAGMLTCGEVTETLGTETLGIESP